MTIHHHKELSIVEAIVTGLKLQYKYKLCVFPILSFKMLGDTN